MNLRMIAGGLLVGLSWGVGTISSAWGAGPPEPGRGGRCDKDGQGTLSWITMSLVPGRVSACTPFSLVLKAWDACGNPMRDLNAPIRWSDSSGGLNPQQPSPFVEGVSSTEIWLARPFSRNRIQVIVEGVSSQSDPFDVVGWGDLHHIAFEALGERQRACSSFTLTAVARDACGNTVRSFQSDAAWTDTSTSIHPPTPNRFIGGVSVTSGVMIPHPYLQDRIRMTASGMVLTSPPFDVNGHGDFERIVIDPIASPKRRCRPFTVTARALDACGNLAESHQGRAEWSDLSGKLRPARPADFVSGISVTRHTSVRKKKQANVIRIQSGGKSGGSGGFDVARAKLWPFSGD